MSLQTIRTARIKEDDGTITDNVPLGAFGIHIKMANGKNLEDTLKEYVHKNMDVGKGLRYETWEEESLVPTQAPDLLRAYIGQGLCYDSRDTKDSQTHFMLNLSDGLKFNDNTENSKVMVRHGRGLRFEGEQTDEHLLEASLAQGLKFDSRGAIMADLGNGLEFNNNQIKVKIDNASNKALEVGAGGVKLTVQQDITTSTYPVSGPAVQKYCKSFIEDITSDDESVTITKTSGSKGMKYDLSVQGGGPGPGPETGVNSVVGEFPIIATPTTGNVTIKYGDDNSWAPVCVDRFTDLVGDNTEHTWQTSIIGGVNVRWAETNKFLTWDNDPDNNTYYFDLIEVTNGGNINNEGRPCSNPLMWTTCTSQQIGDKKWTSIMVYSIQGENQFDIPSAYVHVLVLKYQPKK